MGEFTQLDLHSTILRSRQKEVAKIVPYGLPNRTKVAGRVPGGLSFTPSLASGILLSINREGLLNDVVVINGELVFRFPKNEYGFRHLKDEARILRLLRNHITLEIPSPLFEADDCLAYRETLRRDMLMRLTKDDQQAIADQLAQFSVSLWFTMKQEKTTADWTDKNFRSEHH